VFVYVFEERSSLNVISCNESKRHRCAVVVVYRLPIYVVFINDLNCIFLRCSSIKQSPKTARKLQTGGIGHHINPLNSNSTLNRQASPSNQQHGNMPHYGGGADKCARCSKSVYLAEKKIGAGRVCTCSRQMNHLCHV
jgi:hypothetical protein